MTAPRSGPPLVLLVDDMEDTRLIYAAVLEHRGFATIGAGGAKKAIELAVERQPDVIVIDYAMPGMDGLSATRQLALDPLTGGIPVILITGHVETVRAEDVKSAGARSLITKPCLPEVLEAEIRRVLSGDTEFRRLRGSPR